MFPFVPGAWQPRMYPHVAARAPRKSIKGPGTHSPPRDSICQTCPPNNFVPTEPFPTILTALDFIWEDLSNDLFCVHMRPGEAEKEHVNKEIGNFRFSSPSVDMKIQKAPLES